MTGGASALVPDEYSDFRTRKFWEGFFVAREGKAFEWYGDWTTLGPLLRATLGKPEARILVPGCGNSCLSGDLYDAGFEQIVNVDFSETCVREMLMQNVRSRPKMRWKVMDMTDLRSFEDGSFDVVVDKGSLDALMGDAEDEEGTASGKKFLQEVKRVLCETKATDADSEAKARGLEVGPRAYVIVTLAQEHVMETILDSFSALSEGGSGWKLRVHSIPATRDMRDSPWQPFAIVATKEDAGEGKEVPILDLEFDFKTYGKARGGSKETEQMKQTRAQVTRWKEAAKERYQEVLKRRNHANDLRRSLSDIRAGQRIALDLPQDIPSQAVFLRANTAPRFRAVVLDLEEKGGEQKPCAVFLVPQGREHEWLFSSGEGQKELLSGCGVLRLIIVSLERGQPYGTMEEIQAELSPWVTELAQATCRDGKVKVPYLTIQEGLGQRECIHKCTSDLNGDVVVEDVTLQEGKKSKSFRRMIFLKSSNLIQSEALLTNPDKGIDHSFLSCDYHLPISAGVCLGGSGVGKKTAGKLRVLLVGLGGGGLPMFISQQFSADVTVVELDPVVEGLAKDYFGFEETGDLRSLVGDGLKYIRDYRSSLEGGQEQSKFDVVVIDASGSSSESISCPPKEFLEVDFLKGVSGILADTGLMAVNVVSRSNNAFAQAAETLKTAFSNLFCVRTEDDVNKVVFGFKGEGCLDKEGLVKASSAYLKRTQKTKAHQKDLLSCLKGLEKL
ncbi:methyltransferase [Chloropicon primus]|uniref:Methyltransferase n=1 Tax=Chloropicon primus TaxID=1764295 RepID=A0A5B8MKM0_9CHLO|nr:methyltransferase [Chloropicon primus]UPR00218.1 methyltransferase [Chloropicon primus]|eukprot:QDZ21007.1 methyltransferase [Chloropicon primus]